MERKESRRRKEGRNDGQIGQIAIDKGVPQRLWRERSLEEGRKVEMMVRSL